MPRLLTTAHLFLLTLFSTSIMQAAEPTKDSLDQVKTNLAEQNAVIVDVREKEETDEGYIKGVKLVPLSLLAEEHNKEGFAKILAERIPTDTIVYTYCKAGVRSLMAAEVLEKFKYDVRPLRQGYSDLVAEGFESDTP